MGWMVGGFGGGLLGLFDGLIQGQMISSSYSAGNEGANISIYKTLLQLLR